MKKASKFLFEYKTSEFIKDGIYENCQGGTSYITADGLKQYWGHHIVFCIERKLEGEWFPWWHHEVTIGCEE